MVVVGAVCAYGQSYNVHVGCVCLHVSCVSMHAHIQMRACKCTCVSVQGGWVVCVIMRDMHVQPQVRVHVSCTTPHVSYWGRHGQGQQESLQTQSMQGRGRHCNEIGLAYRL